MARIFPILLLFFLFIPSLFALFHSGFFISDDGEWMIIRLSAFYETLRSGEFPVRFIARLNNGYGYPLADFMYPGFLYIGSLIHLLGFGFITTIKIIFGAGMILSGICTYLWLQKLFGKLPAFFAALIYVYLPYHIFDLYTRGSLGEILALGIVPFILWQMERKSIVLTSLGIGFLMLSHNTLAFLFIVPLYIYLCFRVKEQGWRKIIIPTMPFIVGLLLSFFFWGPALYDLQYTRFQSVVISDWQQYFASTALIGYTSIVLFIVGFFCLFWRQKKTDSYKKEALFFLFIGIFSAFLASPFSSFAWHILPSSIIQFPFRVVSLVLLATAFICGYILKIFSFKKQIFFGSILVIVTIASSYSYLFPKEFSQRDDMYYISNFSTTTTKNEYMPKWVASELPGTPQKKIEIIRGNGSILDETIRGNTISFTAQVDTKALLQINTVYFPGWAAFVDGKKATILYKNQYGLIQVPVDSGRHIVLLRFTETPIRFAADSISILVFIALVVIFFTKMRYNILKLK